LIIKKGAAKNKTTEELKDRKGADTNIQFKYRTLRQQVHVEIVTLEVPTLFSWYRRWNFKGLV
jgi:hypothetical protein